jgi:polyisoprenoid-binding protein YceI
MRKKVKQLAFLLFFISSSIFAQSGAYKVDPEHSFANWKIRHVVSKTSGTIPDMTGEMMINLDDMSQSKINVEMSLLKIDSDHNKRDNHIQEKKFLNSSVFPTITFNRTKIVMQDDKNGVVTGTLAMGGVEKTLDIPFAFLGFGDDPWGGYRVGLEGNIDLKASDFGYSWGLKENSSLGDKIEVNLLVEGIKQ